MGGWRIEALIKSDKHVCHSLKVIPQIVLKGFSRSHPVLFLDHSISSTEINNAASTKFKAVDLLTAAA